MIRIRPKTHAKHIKAIQEAVRESRAQTSAHIEVVAAHASGSYADVDLRWGIVVGLVFLTIILYTPRPVAEHWVLVDIVVGIAMGRFVSSRSAVMRRLLTTQARRHRQVKQSARASFVAHEVGSSRERAGVLVYYSRVEDCLEILPDLGIMAKVPGHRLNQIRHHFEHRHRNEPPARRLVRVVHDLTSALTLAFPPREQEVMTEAQPQSQPTESPA